jgi:hypothetical protein
MGVYELATPAPTLSPTASPTPNPRVEVGKVKVNLAFTNTTKSQLAAKRLIEETRAQNSDTEYLISGTDTIQLPESVQTSSGATNEQLKASILRSRNLTNGTVTLTTIGRRRLSGRRHLDATIVAEIFFTLDETAFEELQTSGTSLESPQFLESLAGDLGVNASDIEITVVGSEVSVEVTLIATSTEQNPLDESVLETLQQLENASATAARTIVEEIGEGQVTVEEVDLCQGRTCSGRGRFEEGVTDENGCVLATGVCQCTGDWWGLNCEVRCSCENGGSCVDSYCQCTYPYYGTRCQDVRTCAVCEA